MRSPIGLALEQSGAIVLVGLFRLQGFLDGILVAIPHLFLTKWNFFYQPLILGTLLH